MSINTYIKTWHTRNCFSTFLKLPCKLQSTRSPRLSNGFWWFLVQNEAEVLLVSFLYFTAFEFWLKNNEHLARSWKSCFPVVYWLFAMFDSAMQARSTLRSRIYIIRTYIAGMLDTSLAKQFFCLHTNFQFPTLKNKICSVIRVSHMLIH